MTKQLKTERIPVMMSADQLKRIDDWAFARRIRSRGEAIRQLCGVGILIHSLWDPKRIADAAGIQAPLLVGEDQTSGSLIAAMENGRQSSQLSRSAGDGAPSAVPDAGCAAQGPSADDSTVAGVQP